MLPKHNGYCRVSARDLCMSSLRIYKRDRRFAFNRSRIVSSHTKPPNPPNTQATTSHRLFDAPTVLYSSSEYRVTASKLSAQAPTIKSRKSRLTQAGARWASGIWVAKIGAS